MRKKRIVMKDIAEAADVHQTTVSLALRNHPSLPAATRQRIQKIAAELGYKPDPALSTLNTYRQRIKSGPPNQTIAFLLNLADTKRLHESHVHTQLIEGARERAEQLGYRIETFWFGRDYPHSEALDRVLKTRGIQGLILGAFNYDNVDIHLDWDAYSLVKINLPPISLPIDAVLSNQLFCVRMAFKKLAASGCQRIGLAIGQKDEDNNRNLFTSGLYSAQSRVAKEQRIEPLVFDSNVTKNLYPMIKDWIHTNRLDGLISNWNTFNIPAIEYCQNSGKQCRFVPIDADQSTLAHGGVNQNHPEAGRRAVEMVVGQLKTFRRGIPPTSTMTLIDPIWHPFA